MNKSNQKRFGNYYDGETIPFQVRVNEKVIREWFIPIGDVLENQLDIEQCIAALYAAEEWDEVTIFLNSDGGSHHVGDSFIYAMNKCKAPIHVIATGRIASYASFILLEADSFELSPFCDVLCHSASFGSVGKMADTKQHVDFTFKQAEKMIRHYYTGFFTDEELDEIINHKKEWYMDADEFVERYNKRNELELEAMEKKKESGDL